MISVCSTTLEKRGPMRTYSSRRSRSSRITIESGDLCASSKTRAICAALADPERPTSPFGRRAHEWNCDCRASVAARAVLPAPGAPSRRIESSEVRSEPWICAKRLEADASMAESPGP